MRALLLSLLFVASAPAWAGDDDLDATRVFSSGKFDAVAVELGLDADQRKAITDAVYQANSAKVDIDARVEKARLELRHLLGADTLDEKAVTKAVDALNAAEGDLRRNRVALILAVRKSVTPEQWQKLVEMRQERRAARRAERHEDDEE
jgi:Spy/CpxP family protein refolding chaperone